jgi:hypothetical protein
MEGGKDGENESEEWKDKVMNYRVRGGGRGKKKNATQEGQNLLSKSQLVLELIQCPYKKNMKRPIHPYIYVYALLHTCNFLFVTAMCIYM